MTGLWYGNAYEAIKNGEIKPLTKFGGAYYKPGYSIKKSKTPFDFWLNVGVEIFFASIIASLLIKNVEIIKN